MGELRARCLHFLLRWLNPSAVLDCNGEHSSRLRFANLAWLLLSFGRALLLLGGGRSLLKMNMLFTGGAQVA